MADPLPPRDPAPDPARLAMAWRIAPLSIAFILDIRHISRGDRDLIDSLLFATVITSNVAPLTQDPGMQKTYANLSSAAPVEFRRPVSINAVAQSMRVPFETARRRIRAMAKNGILEVSAKGVLAPQSILQRPDFIDGIVRRHHRIGQFYRDLGPTGALAGLSVGPDPGGEPPVLITNRFIWEYVLRMADEMITLTGDPLSSLILMEIVRQNIEAFDDEALAAWAHDPGQRGQPARIAAFAGRLGLSPETARRYVVTLERAGFLRRSARGAVARLPADHLPALERMALDNLANIQRMFARMAQLGVLGAWEAPSAQPAASA